MGQKEAFIKVIRILNDLKVDYMIVGGFAVSYWGEPRATHDLDIVIELKTDKKDEWVRIFRKEGYYIDEEAVDEAVNLERMFNVIHPESDLKIDFWIIKEDKYSRKRFERRVSQKLFGIKTFLASPEDLILTKLEWYRESDINKHFLDAQGIFKVQKDILDLKYLKRWAGILGLEDLLNNIIT